MLSRQKKLEIASLISSGSRQIDEVCSQLSENSVKKTNFRRNIKNWMHTLKFEDECNYIIALFFSKKN
jgi:hypothetical protein